MATPSPASRLEATVILGAAALGALLRFWSLGSLGLNHFDEGIYALTAAGLAQSLSPLAVDPGVIPYAPPGVPILFAGSFAVLGISDTAAILVSILSGTLGIVLAGRLALQAFGPGAGATAAILAALSGEHIAFSRMALTDATFAAAWLGALLVGSKFLERPTTGRAIALALAVASAQYVKYNGWLAGVVVALAALPALIPGPVAAVPRRAILGFAALAAGLAALLYLPWYDFVEGHGGYAGLIAHHRGYLQGLDAWPRNLGRQLGQVTALSGLPEFGVIARTVLRMIALLPAVAVVALPGRPFDSMRSRLILLGVAVVACLLEPTAAWWVAAITFPRSLSEKSPTGRTLAASWLLLSLLTPLYHPYARLWLPLLATSWIGAAGGLIEFVRDPVIPTAEGAAPNRRGRFDGVWAAVVVVAAIAQVATSSARPLPGLLDRSDSLRFAALSAADRGASLPFGMTALARPSVLFYLSGRVAASRLPDATSLLRPVSGPSPWLVLDTVQLAQEGEPEELLGRIGKHWREVERWPLRSDLVTRLDVDPGSVSGTSRRRSESLILLRPRREGDDR